ncbi:hypothetical protein THICB3230004 [Thiomonas sp. CB3]|nr:hypothetical protein THICB3180070 [Thiomonas sp. CB3]CQR42408.1 hypothetical protein THICB3230004 [Thiomonas sp. CB3]
MSIMVHKRADRETGLTQRGAESRKEASPGQVPKANGSAPLCHKANKNFIASHSLL